MRTNFHVKNLWFVFDIVIICIPVLHLQPIIVNCFVGFCAALHSVHHLKQTICPCAFGPKLVEVTLAWIAN